MGTTHGHQWVLLHGHGQPPELGGWLFPSPGGGHVSAGHIGKAIADALPEDWTAHTLRHRFATQAYANVRDLRAVQELMGHTSPATTARYVQVPGDTLWAAVAGTAAPARLAVVV